MSNIKLPKGVYKRPSIYSEHMAYYSKIMVGKRTIWVGTFKDVDSAAAAYKKSKAEVLKNLYGGKNDNNNRAVV